MSVFGTGKALLFALCLWWPLPLAAHGDPDQRIISITHDISLNPDDARLFLERGKLLRLNGHQREALRDFEAAARLDRGLIELDLQRGLTLLETGRPLPAIRHLDRFLGQLPDDAEALAARARAVVALGDNLEAAKYFARAIAVSPVPDYYLDRARALAAAGDQHIEAALRGLDAGLERLGPLVSLQRLAIDLELARGNLDGALARVARMSAVTRRPDIWLARRGDILLRAGRRESALEAYTQARAAIGNLSPRRRRTNSVTELECRLHKTLQQLGTAETSPVASNP